MKKKGVSPVIATVLLIAMVVVIALILFLWFRGLVKESITKFDGENIELVCERVGFDASYSGGSLFITNNEDIPIFQMKIKSFKDGSHSTKTLESGWPEFGLVQGGTFSGDPELDSGVTKIVIIPVLLGTSDSGEKTFVCDDRYGYELII